MAIHSTTSKFHVTVEHQRYFGAFIISHIPIIFAFCCSLMSYFISTDLKEQYLMWIYLNQIWHGDFLSWQPVWDCFWATCRHFCFCHGHAKNYSTVVCSFKWIRFCIFSLKFGVFSVTYKHIFKCIQATFSQKISICLSCKWCKIEHFQVKFGLVEYRSHDPSHVSWYLICG